MGMMSSFIDIICVPSIFIYWNSNPITSECTISGDRTFKEVIKLNDVIVPLRGRYDRDVHVQWEAPGKTRQKGGHLQVREGGLRRNQTCCQP